MATGQYRMTWKPTVDFKMEYRLRTVGFYDFEICYDRINEIRNEVEQEQKIKKLRDIFNGIWITPLQRYIIAYYVRHLMDNKKLAMNWKLTPIPNKLNGSHTFDFFSFLHGLNHIDQKVMRDDIIKFVYNGTVKMQRLLYKFTVKENMFGILKQNLLSIHDEFELDDVLREPGPFYCPEASPRVDKDDIYPKFIIDATEQKIMNLFKIDGEIVSDFPPEVTKYIKYSIEEFEFFSLQGYLSKDTLYLWIATPNVDVTQNLYKGFTRVNLPKRLQLWVSHRDYIVRAMKDLATFLPAPKVELVTMYMADSKKSYLNKITSKDGGYWVIKSGHQLYREPAPDSIYVGFITGVSREDRRHRFIIDNGAYEVPLLNLLHRLDREYINKYIGKKVKVYDWEGQLYLKYFTDHDRRKQTK